MKKLRPFLYYGSLELFIFGFHPIFVFSDPVEDYFALSVLSRVFLFLPSSCTSRSGSVTHVMTSSQLIDKLGARRKSSNLKQHGKIQKKPAKTRLKPGKRLTNLLLLTGGVRMGLIPRERREMFPNSVINFAAPSWLNPPQRNPSSLQTIVPIRQFNYSCLT